MRRCAGCHALSSDLPSGTSLPSDTSNNVGVGAGPLEVVCAGAESESVGTVLDVVGEVVATVVTDLVASDGLATLLDVADRCCQSESGACRSEEDGFEGRHDEENGSRVSECCRIDWCPGREMDHTYTSRMLIRDCCPARRPSKLFAILSHRIVIWLNYEIQGCSWFPSKGPYLVLLHGPGQIKHVKQSDQRYGRHQVHGRLKP